jgi:hypothetical protein
MWGIGKKKKTWSVGYTECQQNLIHVDDFTLQCERPEYLLVTSAMSWPMGFFRPYGENSVE